jgi:hypothetical protein
MWNFGILPHKSTSKHTTFGNEKYKSSTTYIPDLTHASA